MFAFQNLEVYKRSIEFNRAVFSIINSKTLDKVYQDQLRRASFSIVLNIAEGSGRFSKADKRNFYVIARGSTYECVAILEYLHELNLISRTKLNNAVSLLEEVSKMLFGLIKSLS